MTAKIAINQATLMQCQTEAFIEVCSKAGFSAVEFRMGNLIETIYRLSVKDLSRLIKRNGVSVLALNALEGATFFPEENLDILRKECELIGRICESIDCPRVITPSARWQASLGPFPDPERIKEICRKRIHFIAETLNPFGVQLVFEPVGLPGFIVKDLELTQEIIGLSGDESVGVALDVHILFCNGVRAASLLTLKSPVSIIHMNDSENIALDKQDVVATRVFPGEGIADTKEWVKTAMGSGYKGYFSLELFRQDIWDMDPEAAAALCYEKMDNYLNSII